MKLADFPDVVNNVDPATIIGRNYYGHPVIDPAYFDAPHVSFSDGLPGGEPPVCTCGWTRHQAEDGTWFEIVDHLADMGEFAEEATAYGI